MDATMGGRSTNAEAASEQVDPSNPFAELFRTPAAQSTGGPTPNPWAPSPSPSTSNGAGTARPGLAGQNMGAGTAGFGGLGGMGGVPGGMGGMGMGFPSGLAMGMGGMNGMPPGMDAMMNDPQVQDQVP